MTAAAHLRYLETVRNVCGKFSSSDGRSFETKRLPRGCFYLLFSDDGGAQRLSDTMSLGEFIELRDLRPGKEKIELTGTHSPCSPPRLERTNALRLSPGKVPDLLCRVGIIRVLSSSQDPQLPEEKGEGHNFQPCSHSQPTWCDLCGDFIWGLYKQSLRCVNCKFTCHYRCRALIQLDCSWDRGSVADHTCVVEHTIETDTNVVRTFVA